MAIGKSDLRALQQVLQSRSILTPVFLGLLGIFEKEIMAVGRCSTGSNRLD